MTPRRVRSTLLAALSLLLTSSAAHAQVSASASITRERTTYHFDAPSSYDTAALVPHFFEQAYVLDNVWLALAWTRSRIVPGVTRVAATPVRQQRATDYDTFYNPGSVVWVSGTTGDAQVHGVRVEHELSLGQSRGITWSGGYRFQLDRANFLDGYRTDVRNGVLVSAQTVTTREYTDAQRHDVFFSATGSRGLGQMWLLRVSATGTPATLSRLAIRLPDKYPDQTLVYHAAGVSGLVRLEFARRMSRLPWSLHLEGGRTWSYRSTAALSRRLLSAGVTVGGPR